MRLKWILAALLILLIATSCSSPSASTPSPAVQAEMDKIELEPGRSALVGQVVTNASGEPVLLPETVVRLARVFWNEDNSDGAFVLEGGSSPSDITNELGVFSHVNIEPGDYVVVVGDVIGIHEIISNPDGTAKIFTAKEGQITNTGIIRVSIE
jgi:hypothetical protein